MKGSTFLALILGMLGTNFQPRKRQAKSLEEWCDLAILDHQETLDQVDREINTWYMINDWTIEWYVNY